MSTLLLLIGLLPSLLCELPAKPIELSKETTFIIEPLAGDGLPNYALAMQEFAHKEMTPEQNGAVPFWQAMGQGEMDDEQFDRLSDEIGLTRESIVKPLTPLEDKSNIQAVVEWLRDTGRSSDVEELEKLAEEYVAWVQANPWTDRDVPPLGKWLAENEPALDLLVEASGKPEFYSPYPNLLVDRTVSVLDIQLQHATGIRIAARALMARAMNLAAENDLEGAWADCRACIALGEHVPSGHMIAEQLMRMHVREKGFSGACVLLSLPEVSPKLARQILDNLVKVECSIDFSAVLNNAERMMSLDYMLRMTTGRLGGMTSEEKDESVDKIVKAGVDLNLSLRWINERYDKIVLTSRIQDRKKRVVQSTKLEQEFEQEAKETSSIAKLGGLSQTFRSNVIGEIFFLYTFPALKDLCDSFDQHEQYLMLTRIAAALAVYKAEHGHYPDKLAELSRSILPEIPKDLYTEEPLQYERQENGFLLYSVFENEADDGASDLYGQIRNGEWQSNHQEVDREKSDLVIRIPVVPQPKP